MKLLTKAITSKLPKLYSQKNNSDPTVRLKFFTPWSNWTWFVTEGEERDGSWLFFGLVVGQEIELGYFTLTELESVSGPFSLKIERDLYFTPQPLSVIKSREENKC